ncbi:hypothetical protein EUGRSUZ_H01289, partial [Eucalyptus grandis]
LLVAFVIIPALLQACSGNKFYVSKIVHVQIFNSLPKGVTLTVHCKSEDDDHDQQVPPNGMWQSRFWSNVMGTKLFSCEMQWPGQFHYFDIYYQKRDVHQCGRLCMWYVRTTGPCLYLKDCYEWNS